LRLAADEATAVHRGKTRARARDRIRYRRVCAAAARYHDAMQQPAAAARDVVP